jgi:simple sugar transport system ATP-binding protein
MGSNMQDNTLLQMRHIEKRFPGVLALHNVDFTLRKGEIHALMGENGAGKSTLIKILTGVYQMDGGEIRIDGESAVIRSPQDAQNKGISTVYQEITLCPNLTVAENMFIGRSNGTWVKQKEYEKRADEILQELGIPARSSQQLGS